MVKPRYLVPSTAARYVCWCPCSWNLDGGGPNQRGEPRTRPGGPSGLTTSIRALRPVFARVVCPQVEPAIIDDGIDRDDLYLARVVEELCFCLGVLFEHFRDWRGNGVFGAPRLVGVSIYMGNSVPYK